MIDKKYELMDDCIEISSKDTKSSIDNIKLYRIKALKNFGDVKAGDIGGCVQSEYNLSHFGNCWIYNDAKVFGNALVSGDAAVINESMVYDTAIICNKAIVGEHAEVFNNARVLDNAEIFNAAEVYGNCIIHDDVQIFGKAKVFDNCQIFDYVNICDASVYGNALIYNDTHIEENARIYKNAVIYGGFISFDADITEETDVLSMHADNNHKENNTTFYKTKSGDINVIEAKLFMNKYRVYTTCANIDEYVKSIPDNKWSKEIAIGFADIAKKIINKK